MNNHNNNNPTNGSQACAACKYQRRKCAPDCPLAPYFPHDHQKHFLNAHKLFGVSNIMKTLRNLGPPKEKEIAMKCMIFQANVRANDPVGGCYRMILELQQQIEHGDAELKFVLHQLAICRMRAQIEIQEENTAVDVDVDSLSVYNNQHNNGNYFQYGDYGEQEQEYCPVVKDGSKAFSSCSTTVQMQDTDTEEPFVEECEDIKPILSMFDDRQPPSVSLDFKGSIICCSDKAVIRQDVDSLHQEQQEHDLKGAASQFSLTS